MHFLPSDEHSSDGRRLYRKSCELLLAHEDKSYPGAMIASMSIPWGETRSDEDLGGYHLRWTRDMAKCAAGLLAAEDVATPLRTLVYQTNCQSEEGGFFQNFWINGTPYWTSIQLDEVAFPVILAWRLDQAKALAEFDPYQMVLNAASYLIRQAPTTPQERWEESSGYSPSTLASTNAALVCAGAFARRSGDEGTAQFLEDFADFMEAHVETWTVTNCGLLVRQIVRHYVRINPSVVDSPAPDENPDHSQVTIRDREPGQRSDFPACEIVDAGFHELVRYGIRSAHDPLIEDSVRVVDAILRTDFACGPSLRRYNYDGYGQKDDGSPFQFWGVGRAWPLLTGERAHYELAAGRNIRPYISALEHFCEWRRPLTGTGLGPRRLPAALLFRGKSACNAMPLMWAHSEYLKLLRSYRDDRVFISARIISRPSSEGANWRRLMSPLTSAASSTLSRIISGNTHRILPTPHHAAKYASAALLDMFAPSLRSPSMAFGTMVNEKTLRRLDAL